MDITFDEKASVLHIKPVLALTAEDFLQISKTIDPYIKQHGSLKGLIIEAMKFPGWKNINAFIAHVKFIKNHQAKIQKIALVTNSKLAELAKNCIGPFVRPQIKHFPYDQIELAKQWILH